MRKKNSIKTPNNDTIRGIGKLDYTERGKLCSTLKRLESSFEQEVRKIPGKKNIVKCPGCGKKFKSNSGKIPQHYTKRFYLSGTTLCTGKKPFFEKPIIVSKVNVVKINGYKVEKGDSVAFTTFPWKFSFQDMDELVEHKIKNIYLMDNNKKYLELEGVENYIPINIFVNNFIKL